jgi:tetratricopeptide (TPR) repeat protein
MEPRFLARTGHKLVSSVERDWVPELNRADWLTKLAVQLNPELPMAWWARAEVLLAARNLQEAGKAVDHALALDPEDANAWLVKALVLHQTGAETEASEAFRRSVELARRWEVKEGDEERDYLDPLLRLIAETDDSDSAATERLVEWCLNPQRPERLKVIGAWLF